MKGEVTITKVYKDGTKEKVLSQDCNVLTDGFGINLTNLFTSNPADDIDRFKIGYFQVGTSGYYQETPILGGLQEEFAYSLPLNTHNNFYELSSALTDSTSYGTQGNIKTVVRDVTTVTNPFSPSDELVYTTSSMVLAVLEDDPTTKLTDRTINVKITIDEDSLNGVSIREFGLFSKNPTNRLKERPALVAYKSLSTPIEKNEYFNLDIDWVIKLDPYQSNGGTDYYTNQEIKKLGEIIKFYPSVHAAGIKFYSYSMSASDATKINTYDVIVESSTPTTRDGYLYYSLSGTALSGYHYAIDPDAASPIFWPKGSQQTVIQVSALSAVSFSDPSTRLEIHLDGFTGGKRVPNPLLDQTPDKFYIFFQDDGTPPTAALSQTGSGPITITATLDASSRSETRIYFEASGNAAYEIRDVGQAEVLSTDNHYITVRPGQYTGSLDIAAPAGALVDVSAFNPLSSDTEVNIFAHSNDFGPEEQIPVSIKIQDLVDNYVSIGTPDSPWYLENIGATGKIYWPGYPTQKTHSGNDTFSNGPTQFMYLNTEHLDDIKAPDKIQPATLAYAPSSIYIWAHKPTDLNPVNSVPKIRKSYTSYSFDSLGRTINLPDQRQPYSSDTSTLILSMYVKKIDTPIQATHPNYSEPEEITNSEYIAIRFYTRGFLGVGNAIAPGTSVYTATVIFRWVDDYLEPYTSDLRGAFNGQPHEYGVFSGTADDITEFGVSDRWAGTDGWQRIFFAIEVPPELTDAAAAIDLTLDGSGATQQWFINPTITHDGKLPGFTGTFTAPTTLSGSLIAWAQLEDIKDSVPSTYNGFLPAEYQPRDTAYFSPLGGAYISSTSSEQILNLTF